MKNTEGAPAPLADADGIRKYLPRSYRTAFNFTTPRTRVREDRRQLSLRDQGLVGEEQRLQAVEGRDHLGPRGRVLPPAAAAGRANRAAAPSAGDAPVRRLLQGGRLGLLPPHVRARRLRHRQRRHRAAGRTRRAFPPIDEPRQLFAALQFPVVAGPASPNGDFDTLKIEAADYDDGFAKVVHVTQPVSSNLLSEEPDGVHSAQGHRRPPRLGRRAAADLAEPADARRPGDAGQARRRPAGSVLLPCRRSRDRRSRLALARPRPEQGGPDAGGTSRSRPHRPSSRPASRCSPSKVNGAIDTAYWLPSYFTQWYGASLVLPDGRAAELDASGALAKPGTYSDANIPAKPTQKGDLYEPVLSDDCELKYGHEYEFRVRLGDLTGGGPLEDDDELNDAPATSASLVFQRYVAPKRLTVTPDDPQDDADAGSVQFLQGTLVHRRPTAAGISGAPLHRARHRRRVPEAAGRQDVSAYRQARGPDDQGVSGRQLLRSRRRSHAGGRRREDAAPRQPGVGLAARALHPAVFDPADRSTPTSRRRSPFSSSTGTRTSSTSGTRSISAISSSRRTTSTTATRSCCRGRATSASRSTRCARTSRVRRSTSASPRRGSTRSCTASASRSSSSCARMRRTRSTSSSRGWSRTSCRVSTFSPIRRR